MKKTGKTNPLAGLARRAGDWQKKLAKNRARAARQGRQNDRDQDVARSRAARRGAARWKAVRKALTPRAPQLAVPKLAMPRWMPGLLACLLFVSLLGNLLMYFRFTSARPLVTVGSHVVRRGEYLAAMEQASGRPVLNKIVYTQIIRQAAAKANLMPDAADVETRLKEMQRENDPALALTPPNLLWDDLTTQMALENLRMQGQTASEADVQAFYQAHKSAFAHPAQVGGPVVVTDTAAQAQKAAALLRAGRAPAAIAAHPGLRVAGQNGFAINLAAAPPGLQAAISRIFTALPPGQTATLRVGPNFWTFQATTRRQAEQDALADVRGEITRLVRLQKAPSAPEELARLYAAHPPTFDMARYAAFFPAPPSPQKTARKTP